jgi:hypothetical protein
MGHERTKKFDLLKAVVVPVWAMTAFLIGQDIGVLYDQKNGLFVQERIQEILDVDV